MMGEDVMGYRGAEDVLMAASRKHVELEGEIVRLRAEAAAREEIIATMTRELAEAVEIVSAGQREIVRLEERIQRADAFLAAEEARKPDEDPRLDAAREALLREQTRGVSLRAALLRVENAARLLPPDEASIARTIREDVMAALTDHEGTSPEAAIAETFRGLLEAERAARKRVEQIRDAIAPYVAFHGATADHLRDECPCSRCRIDAAVNAALAPTGKG
jgi:hypothetical protein